MTPAQAASVARYVASLSNDPTRAARRLMAQGIDPQRAIGTVAGTTLLDLADSINARAAAAPVARKEASA